MKKLLSYIFLAAVFLVLASSAKAVYVNGYYRSNGTYVQPYNRTSPNYYKWDNYSFDGDWGDSYNDRSWYRDYGYDPEPFDDEYVDYYYDYSSSYDYNDSYDSYDYYNYY